MPREKVCLVGSGNWGSAIARIIGANTAAHPETFEREIQMWVFEEVVGGKKLTEIINTTHENVKYLPGAKLPPNVVANPSLASAASGATMLIFVLPHQFLRRICPDILRSMAPRCKAISLIKGIEFEAGRPKLISSMIHEALSAAVPVSVLMGANVASEVAKDEFCEATIGCADAAAAAAWRLLFDRPTFRIQTVDDVAGVELCGALKNVVALGAGFCDGLGLGGNTKAAIVRIGLGEMERFCGDFFSGVQSRTFFQSCGIADLITTCYGGRNRKCAAAFAKGGRSWVEIERGLLNGQKLQGTITCEDVMTCLVARGRVGHYPLFARIHEIAFQGKPPQSIVDLPAAPQSRL